MTDKIINFYDKLNIKGNKLPKNWNKHLQHAHPSQRDHFVAQHGLPPALAE